MSTPTPQDPHTLADYESFLRLLAAEAVPYSVIGGCAVGAYARLRGVEAYSGDLDVYTTGEQLNRVVELVRRKGVLIRNRPRERSVPVAAFDWEGKPVNVLSSSTGLPDPSRVTATARDFKLQDSSEFFVPVADPFDLLANKLAVNRPKDRPHIAILRSFIEEEIVDAFRTETRPRLRFLPAQRYLDVTGERALSDVLAGRLVPLARLDTDCRFLAGVVPSRSRAEELIKRAPAGLREELRAIVSRRRLRR